MAVSSTFYISHSLTQHTYTYILSLYIFYTLSILYLLPSVYILITPYPLYIYTPYSV